MHLPQIYHLDRSKSGPRRVGPSQGWGWWSNRKMSLPIGDGTGKLTLTLHGNVGRIGSNVRGIVRGIRLPIHFYFDDDLKLDSHVNMIVNGSWPFKWGVRKSGCKRISKHEIQSAWLSLRFIHHATSCGKVPASWTCIPQPSWYRQAWNSAEMRPYRPVACFPAEQHQVETPCSCKSSVFHSSWPLRWREREKEKATWRTTSSCRWGFFRRVLHSIMVFSACHIS